MKKLILILLVLISTNTFADRLQRLILNRDPIYQHQINEAQNKCFMDKEDNERTCDSIQHEKVQHMCERRADLKYEMCIDQSKRS